MVTSMNLKYKITLRKPGVEEVYVVNLGRLTIQEYISLKKTFGDSDENIAGAVFEDREHYENAFPEVIHCVSFDQGGARK